jgi:hypothetical protein
VPIYETKLAIQITVKATWPNAPHLEAAGSVEVADGSWAALNTSSRGEGARSAPQHPQKSMSLLLLCRALNEGRGFAASHHPAHLAEPIWI